MKNTAKTELKKGLLIILSGPSGVGKGTIRKRIMENPDLNLVYSVSLTTRKPRNEEVDGVDYKYISKEKFEEYIAKDNLLEWAEFVGNYYGTPKDWVEEQRNQGKNVILEIEVEGATQVLSTQKGNRVFSIFLIPPSLEELRRRIRNRHSETPDVISKRLAKAENEIGLKYQYHYVVLNDNQDRAAEEISQIILSKINAKITS